MDSGRHKPPKGPGDSRDSKGSKDSTHRQGQESTAPGQVAVDSRGRNVWQFHGEAIDSTSMMLQRLDNPSLEIEPTRRTKRIDAAAEAAAAKVPGGKKASGQPPEGKAAAGASKGQGSSARGSQSMGTTQSFEQRFQVKPGKNQGGGFDPYNRS
jgi:hypothetical protein